MTKVEDAIYAHSKYKALGDDASKDERQRVLDEITQDVLAQLTPLEVCASVSEVYGATVGEYAANPHTQGVIDELIEFMEMLPDGGKVLDVGCGLGRDVLFMSIGDRKFREEHMGRVRQGKSTREKFPVPTKTFLVVGLDKASEMLEEAEARRDQLSEEGLGNSFQVIELMGMPVVSIPVPFFFLGDMHSISSELDGEMDGIWSCTALFTHTPRSLLRPAMESVARVLKPGGVFFVSYINGRAEGGQYDKLLLSSTGFIKYFSQPDPDEIAELARSCGLILESETISDFEVNGRVIKKDLHVSQFFRKA